MDSSFGGSTSFMATPSPLSRVQPRPAPSGGSPLAARRPAPSATPDRFQSQQPLASSSTSTPGGGKMVAGPQQTPSSLSRPPARYPLLPTATSSLPSTPSSAPRPSAGATPKLGTPASARADGGKVQVAPVTRGETARRLRVNATVLVVWAVVSRSRTYAFVTARLVEAVPWVDGPLHYSEQLFTLLLIYNAAEALYSLLTPAPAAPAPTPGTPAGRRAPTPGSVTRSSPKTRATPSAMQPSPSSLAQTYRAPTSTSAVNPPPSASKHGILASEITRSYPYTSPSSWRGSPASVSGVERGSVGPGAEEARAEAAWILGRSSPSRGWPLGKSFARSVDSKQAIERFVASSD